MADKKKSLHVKSGDRVIITAGKDKGKPGNIKKALPSEGKVIVEGATMSTKATKANPAYGIQGGAALFCQKLSGDYYNVVGLPVCRLAQILRQVAPELMGDTL